jgi:hypothetical protein
MPLPSMTMIAGLPVNALAQFGPTQSLLQGRMLVACRLAGLSALEVTDNQIAIGGLTEGTNLRRATALEVTDNQIAIGGLTEGTNLRVGREGQANRSHDC